LSPTSLPPPAPSERARLRGTARAGEVVRIREHARLGTGRGPGRGAGTSSNSLSSSISSSLSSPSEPWSLATERAGGRGRGRDGAGARIRARQPLVHRARHSVGRACPALAGLRACAARARTRDGTRAVWAGGWRRRCGPAGAEHLSARSSRSFRYWSCSDWIGLSSILIRSSSTSLSSGRIFAAPTLPSERGVARRL